MAVPLYFQLVHPDALPPQKAYETDTGYDLSIVDQVRTINENVTLFDSGVKVRVPNGYYVEIVPRSSIIKSGYMLANSVGIIDENYRGNLYVALAKIDPEAPPIQLPYKGFQLIMRKRIDAEPIQVDDISSDITDRGDGGFGSTGH
jgi:dUTP pyrophosphatase